MDQNRKIKLLFTTLLGLHACFIIYGSMVPFGFESIPFSEAWGRFRNILSSPVVGFSRSNLLANILIGIPGPFLLLAVLHKKNSRLILVLIPAALLYSAALAGTAEFLQLFLPRRITMLSDILAQTAGGAIGVMFWLWIGPDIRAMLKALMFHDKETRTENLFFWTYLAVVLLLYALPMDMTAKLGLLHAQWQDGRILIVPFSKGFDLSIFISWFQTIITWIPVGWFLVRFRSWSLFAVLLAAITGSALLEFMQIFVLSRTTDTTEIILGAAGGVLGWGAGAWGANWTILPVHGKRKTILFACLTLAVWFVLVIREFWYPFDFHFDRKFLIKSVRSTGLLPFHMYIGKNYLISARNILEIVICFIPLGVIFSSCITRFCSLENHRMMTSLFFITACILALGIEFGQVFIPGRYPDITDVIIMITGAMLGYGVANLVWKHK